MGCWAVITRCVAAFLLTGLLPTAQSNNKQNPANRLEKGRDFLGLARRQTQKRRTVARRFTLNRVHSATDLRRRGQKDPICSVRASFCTTKRARTSERSWRKGDRIKECRHSLASGKRRATT